MSTTISDSELIRAYRGGDEQAFEILLTRHQDRVYTKINFIVRDSELANDLFQDTFIKVVRLLKEGKYVEEGKFLPWILRIAHNMAIDHFRRNKKMRMVRSRDEMDVFATIQTGDAHIEDILVKDQINSDVRCLIDELPEDQREVVRMRMYDNLSFKEIAETTGVSINTALGRMRYAVINLRKIVEENNIQLTPY
ncbi:MAG: RNA polymerase subunit sigma-24 [Crocinitomicaceae bacterium]|nr:RNA polymerase subunit sigma-24 [Crocinitomicaceae bacterium]|tara:strand:- start:2697 stop:3281 length:585 start_codon:yes stop_codon:yes gene_type:complete